MSFESFDAHFDGTAPDFETGGTFLAPWSWFLKMDFHDYSLKKTLKCMKV